MTEFELIAGERRWRAAKRAGLPTIPVVVRTVDDVLSLEQALVENLHRQDLNPLEEAAAYQQLIEDFDLTHDDVAERVGKSRVGDDQHAAAVPAAPVDPAAGGRGPAVGRATPGRCSAPRTGPSRRRWPSGSWPRGCRCARSRRRCGHAGRREDRPPGRAAGAAPRRPGASPSSARPGMQELEELLAEHLATRVKVTMEGRGGGARSSSSSPTSTTSSGSTGR